MRVERSEEPRVWADIHRREARRAFEAEKEYLEADFERQRRRLKAEFRDQEDALTQQHLQEKDALRRDTARQLQEQEEMWQSRMQQRVALALDEGRQEGQLKGLGDLRRQCERRVEDIESLMETRLSELHKFESVQLSQLSMMLQTSSAGTQHAASLQEAEAKLSLQEAQSRVLQEKVIALTSQLQSAKHDLKSQRLLANARAELIKANLHIGGDLFDKNFSKEDFIEQCLKDGLDRTAADKMYQSLQDQAPRFAISPRSMPARPFAEFHLPLPGPLTVSLGQEEITMNAGNGCLVTWIHLPPGLYSVVVDNRTPRRFIGNSINIHLRLRPQGEGRRAVTGHWVLNTTPHLEQNRQAFRLQEACSLELHVLPNLVLQKESVMWYELTSEVRGGSTPLSVLSDAKQMQRDLRRGEDDPWPVRGH